MQSTLVSRGVPATSSAAVAATAGHSTLRHHQRSVLAAVAAPPAALLTNHQEDGLQKLRLLAPHLLAGVPAQLLHLQEGQQLDLHQQTQLQQQQQQELFQVEFSVDSVDSWEPDMFESSDTEQHSTVLTMPQQHTNGAAAAGAKPQKARAKPSKCKSNSSNSRSSSSKVHPKKLMAAIEGADGVGGLRALLDQHQASVDPLAAAAMLTKLAHTWSSALKQAQRTRKEERFAERRQQQQQPLPGSDGGTVPDQLLRSVQDSTEPAAAVAASGEDASEQAVMLLQKLLAVFVLHIPRYSSRQLSSALWVVGRFNRAAAAHEDIRQAAAVILQALLGGQTQLQQQQQQGYDDMLGSFTATGSVAAAGPVCLLQHDGTAADLQNVLWALGRLAKVTDVHRILPTHQQCSSNDSSSSSKVLVMLDQLCSVHLLAARWIDGQFPANCLYGFAHMDVPAPHLFEALVQRANPNYCKYLQSQHVVVITWAAAKLGHHSSVLCDRLLWRAVVVRRALYPQGVAMLLAGCARVKHTPDPRAVAQLVQVCKAQWWKLRGKHLSNLVYGLMGTNCLQNHRAFFMGVLLCQVTVKLHELQPLGVATVLQALLQVSRQTPQHTTAQLSTHLGDAADSSSSSGGGGVSDARREDSGDVSGSRSSFGERAQTGRAQGTLQQRLGQQSSAQHGDTGIGYTLPKPQVSPAAAARAQIGLSAALSGAGGDSNRQLALLLRQMGVHIVQQLPQTTPKTLYNIIICLAGVGYYEPSLYNRLAEAAAAVATAGAIAGSGAAPGAMVDRQAQLQEAERRARTLQEQQGCVYNSRQSLHLLQAFSSLQHAVPQLWQQLLPVVAADAGSLTDTQLSLLLSSAAGMVGGGSRGLGAGQHGAATQQLQHLLQLAAVALQRQQQQQQGSAVRQLQGLVRLAAACSTIVLAAAQVQQQQQQGGNAVASGCPDLLQTVHKQADRLVGQLTTVVCSQPQLLPWTSMLQLLHAALLLQSMHSFQLQHAGAISNSSSCSSCSSDSVPSPAWQPVAGPRAVQQLAQLVHDHPKHWASGATPQDLVMLLQCATHPDMPSSSSSNSSSSNSSSRGLHPADAYAEELLHCLGRCNAQTLVTLLQVLAAAWQQQGGRKYGHVGLVTAAARQLHSKMRLATTMQLAATVAALDVLQQHETPLYRAASRLLAPTAAVAEGRQQ